MDSLVFFAWKKLIVWSLKLESMSWKYVFGLEMFFELKSALKTNHAGAVKAFRPC